MTCLCGVDTREESRGCGGVATRGEGGVASQSPLLEQKKLTPRRGLAPTNTKCSEAWRLIFRLNNKFVIPTPDHGELIPMS